MCRKVAGSQTQLEAIKLELEVSAATIAEASELKSKYKREVQLQNAMRLAECSVSGRL